MTAYISNTCHICERSLDLAGPGYVSYEEVCAAQERGRFFLNRKLMARLSEKGQIEKLTELQNLIETQKWKDIDPSTGEPLHPELYITTQRQGKVALDGCAIDHHHGDGEFQVNTTYVCTYYVCVCGPEQRIKPENVTKNIFFSSLSPSLVPYFS